MKRLTLSACNIAAIVRAVKRRAPDSYPMSLVGDEPATVIAAVNQGIDSHLQVCNVSERGDSYVRGERVFTATTDNPGHWRKGDRVVHTVTLECRVSRESLPVLVRRLLESGDEAGEGLASCIADTLGIEMV